MGTTGLQPAPQEGRGDGCGEPAFNLVRGCGRRARRPGPGSGSDRSRCAPGGRRPDRRRIPATGDERGVLAPDLPARQLAHQGGPSRRRAGHDHQARTCPCRVGGRSRVGPAAPVRIGRSSMAASSGKPGQQPVHQRAGPGGQPPGAPPARPACRPRSRRRHTTRRARRTAGVGGRLRPAPSERIGPVSPESLTAVDPSAAGGDRPTARSSPAPRRPAGSTRGGSSPVMSARARSTRSPSRAPGTGHSSGMAARPRWCRPSTSTTTPTTIEASATLNTGHQLTAWMKSITAL